MPDTDGAALSDKGLAPSALPPTTAMIVDTRANAPSTQTPLLEKHEQPTLKPPKYHWYASRYLCLITVFVVLCFSAKHLANKTRYYLSRRNRKAHRPSKHGFRRLSSLQTVVEQMVQKWTVLSTLPRWLYGPDTLLDAAFTAVYCALLFFFSLNHSRCESLSLSSLY